ncbi:RNA-binding protein MEX3D isoform X3 [Mirounga angustirostris]|uniref:RNA-binding protein MEX3D isoform X3 n=1 Tax=Mirounga angustirostris TaxID=9716 RepID=UPI00313BFDEE
MDSHPVWLSVSGSLPEHHGLGVCPRGRAYGRLAPACGPVMLWRVGDRVLKCSKQTSAAQVPPPGLGKAAQGPHHLPAPSPASTLSQHSTRGISDAEQSRPDQTMTIVCEPPAPATHGLAWKAHPKGSPPASALAGAPGRGISMHQGLALTKGSDGCKIKALRAKTNTYIKTPVRGEEPVFIVTGRKEDVEMAKREILSAAEHFSVIRATRSKAGGLPGAAQGPPNLPGQTTIQVRVPYRVVGLVVGPKGATIKRIQQRTHTYIVTPGRDKEPVFAVTGMPENVDRAREEIEAHITLRTGAFTDAGPDSDFHANGTDVCLDLLGTAAGLWAKAPNPGRRPPAPTAGLRGDGTRGGPGGPEAFYAGGRGGPPVPDAGPASPYGGSGNGGFTFGGDGPGAPSGPPAPEDCDFGFDFLALDLTVPAAATIWAPFERAAPLPAFSSCSAVNGAPAPPAPGARRSSGAGTPRHSPTLPEPGGLALELPLGRRGAPDPVGALAWRPAQGALSSFSGGAGFSAATSLPSGSSASACPPLDSSASEGGRKPPGAVSPAAPPPAAAAPRPGLGAGVRGVRRGRGDGRARALRPQPLLHGLRRPHLRQERARVPGLPHACHPGHSYLFLAARLAAAGPGGGAEGAARRGRRGQHSQTSFNLVPGVETAARRHLSS